MNPLVIMALIVWFISAVGLVVLVLLHSGKGTGMSEMLGGVMSPTASGTSIIEKNLDRLTIACAVVFLLSLLIMMNAYPNGS